MNNGWTEFIKGWGVIGSTGASATFLFTIGRDIATKQDLKELRTEILKEIRDEIPVVRTEPLAKLIVE